MFRIVLLGRVACIIEAAYMNSIAIKSQETDAPFYWKNDLIEPYSEQPARKPFEVHSLPCWQAVNA